MPYVYTITPHQKINSWGISSQWEGKHTRFDEGGTIESLEIRKKIGKDHNDMPRYKYFLESIKFRKNYTRAGWSKLKQNVNSYKNGAYE